MQACGETRTTARAIVMIQYHLSSESAGTGNPEPGACCSKEMSTFRMWRYIRARHHIRSGSKSCLSHMIWHACLWNVDDHRKKERRICSFLAASCSKVWMLHVHASGVSRWKLNQQSCNWERLVGCPIDFFFDLSFIMTYMHEEPIMP